MPTTSRFAVAAHVATLLAHEHPAWLTSDHIAASVNTNPVVIRRLVGDLVAAGIVESRLGPGGGCALRREAASISLRDVYRATRETALVRAAPSMPNPQCPVGRSIQGILEELVDDAETAFERSLGSTSVADLVDAVQQRA